jgi:uncharacterized protein (TIGR03435 family)
MKPRVEPVLNFVQRASFAAAAVCAVALVIMSDFVNVAVARAQFPDDNSLKFEVASIRRCKSDFPADRRSSASESPTPQRIHLRCQTVEQLIQWAYLNFADARYNPWTNTPIEGGPSWIHSELYEIDAEAGSPVGRGIMNGPMLRALLEERFNLRIHKGSREGGVFALTVGKGGPKLELSKEGSCISSDFSQPPPLPGSGQTLPNLCGMFLGTAQGFSAYQETMAAFCTFLSDELGRPVIDKTGIAGKFDLHLDFSPADLRNPDVEEGNPLAPVILSDPSSWLGLIESSVRKLGLKLVSTKGQVEVLVIDNVERSSAN